MDDMGRGFPSSHSYRNEGESASGSSQARSSSVPTAYGSFQIGSGGGMASTLPSNSAFAGHTQSQAANIMEGAMSPAYTQSHLAAGNVPPGFWDSFLRRRLQSPAENTEGSLPSHPHGSPFPGTDIVGNTAWVSYSPSPQLGQSYPGVAANVPIGFISHTNVGQNAFQPAGAPYGVQWRGYGAVPSLYQPLIYPNQSTGGFLSAGLGSNAVPGNWVDYRSRNMSGLSYQTIVPQPDASFTGGFQYHNNNNNSTRVNQRGQSSEQTAPYDFDNIQGAAARGDYEFDHWITHGHPSSPSHTSSALRIPSGSFSAPPSQGVAMAIDMSMPMPKPPSSLQGSISNWQTGNVMVSSSNEAAGAPSIQNRSDPIVSNYVVQENISESSHGSQAIPTFSSQSIGISSCPSSRRRKSHATKAYVGGSSSSALRKPIIVRPIQPSSMATSHPVYAGGSSSSILPGPVIATPIQPSSMATANPTYIGGSSSSTLPEPIIVKPIQPSPMTTTHPAYVGGNSSRASLEPVTVRPTRSSPMATPRPAYARGSSSSGLPKPTRGRPIWPSPRATPHRARGEPNLPFKRPPPPQKHAMYASPSTQPMRIHDHDDDDDDDDDEDDNIDSDNDLWMPQPEEKWHRVDISDPRPELLGFKCELCNLDLAIKPPGTSSNAVMVHVVLPCGHCYHSSCYDEVHGVVGKDEDPPCFLCPGNEA